METIPLKRNIKTYLSFKMNEMLAELGLRSGKKLDHIIDKTIEKLSKKISKRAKAAVKENQEDPNGTINVKANGFIRYSEI